MIKVLYVDDEEGLLDISKAFLEQSGELTVDVSSSVKEAVDVLDGTRYDAIISDFQMPEMNGIDFLKKLRSANKKVPFILFTGKGREEVVIEALNSGADFYLQKGGEPIAQFRELEHKVREAVRRSRAEQALKENEERLTRAQAIGLMGCWECTWDDKGAYIWGSEEGFRLFGLHKEGGGIMPPELIEACIIEREMASKALQDLIKDGAEYNLEYEIAPADGGPHRFIHSVAQLIRDSAGRPIKVLGMIQDITDRKNAERVLKESEAKYRGLFDNIQECVSLRRLIYDERGEIVEAVLIDANPAALRIYGAGSIEELRGRMYQEMASPKMASSALDVVKRMKATGRSVTKEEYSDVNDRYYLVTAAPLENDLVITTSVDITHMKKAEEALRNSREEYSTLINTIPDFIVRCDLNGIITLVNDWTLEVSGYQREEVIGNNLFSFVAPEDVERAAENVRKMMSGQIGPISYHLMMRDGRKVLFEATGEILRSTDGCATGMIFVGREITERRNGRKNQ